MPTFHFVQSLGKRARILINMLLRRLVSSQRPLRFTWEQVGPWISSVLLVGLLAGPIGLFVWLIFGTEIFHAQAITVLDARDDTTIAVETMVKEALQAEDRRIWRYSLFFVDLEGIERRILTTLPHVRSVDVRRQLPGTVKVIIQEKKPALLLLAYGKYYFVDDQGVAYEEARLDALPGLILPTVKNREQRGEVAVGRPVVNESFVGFVHEIQARLPEVVEAEVVEVLIPSLAAREVRFQLSNNWEIRFDVTRSAESQLQLIHDLIVGTLPLEEKRMIEYIDLRIPNRIYYKTRTLAP